MKFQSTWKQEKKALIQLKNACTSVKCTIKTVWLSVSYADTRPSCTFMMDRLCEQWEFFLLFIFFLLNVFFSVFFMLFLPSITVYFFFSWHESYRRRLLPLSLSHSYVCNESLSSSNMRKTIGTSIVRSVNHWITIFMYSMRVFVTLLMLDGWQLCVVRFFNGEM